jgi:hypothetical protein
MSTEIDCNKRRLCSTRSTPLGSFTYLETGLFERKLHHIHIQRRMRFPGYLAADPHEQG